MWVPWERIHLTFFNIPTPSFVVTAPLLTLFVWQPFFLLLLGTWAQLFWWIQTIHIYSTFKSLVTLRILDMCAMFDNAIFKLRNFFIKILKAKDSLVFLWLGNPHHIGSSACYPRLILYIGKIKFFYKSNFSNFSIKIKNKKILWFSNTRIFKSEVLVDILCLR